MLVMPADGPDDLPPPLDAMTIHSMFQAITSAPDPDPDFQEGEAGFRALMDRSPAIAWMKDEEGRYVYINESLERLFNVCLNDMQGKTDFDWLSPETAREVRENDRRVLATGRPTRLVEESTTPDGRVHTW